MSAPPVPPRPYEAYDQHQSSHPPPVPPLPPDLRYQEERYQSPSPYESPPHFDNPLAAPRPHRLDPSIPANMARSLDEQVYQQQDYRNPAPGGSINFAPGFSIPAPQVGPSQLPPPQGASWSPWGGVQGPSNGAYAQQQQQQQGSSNGAYGAQGSYSGQQQQQNPYIPQQQQQQQQPPQQRYQSPPASLPYPGGASGGTAELSQSMASLTFSSPSTNHRPMQQRAQSTYGPPPKAPSPPRPAASSTTSLTAPLPTIAQLQAALPAVQQPSHDPALRIAWCRDVFFLVDRTQAAPSPTTDPPVGPITIPDAALERLARTAVPLVLALATSSTESPPPPHVAEAIYLRAMFASSGGYPEFVRHNPRTAFRDFEAAARGGYAGAWFRLGRDYENFNDFAHARDCFERGLKLGVESCAYRLGMAHLLGQLGLPASPEQALPLLHRAAQLSSLEVPQPAYVYALLLLSEFTQVTLPPALFDPFIPPSSSPTLEARKHLERAAFLHFAPAQYKLGHAYEFAQPPFPFDPLLSVQYYSLASQQGEVEADMALSKWFLCGSEGAGPDGAGAFDKDEALAWTFADKAARKGLPSAEFAMGYYAEVGVGGPKDVQAAVRWYTKAKEHGNADAFERLKALEQPSPQALSRQEHDTITENKLVRKRTQAKQRSETQPLSPPWNGQTFPHQAQTLPPARAQQGPQVIENIRKSSLMSGYNPQQAQPMRMPPVQEAPAYAPPSQSPNLRPQKQQQYPATHRYTLSDSAPPPMPPMPAPPMPGDGRPPGGGRKSPGPAGGRKSPGSNRPGGGRNSSPARPQSNVSGQSGRPPRVASNLSLGDTLSPSSAGSGSSGLPTPRPPNSAQGGGGKATTFAEMGFHGAKAEDKECVIM